WISETYLCSWGEAIDAMVPGVLKKGKTSVRARSKEIEQKETYVPDESLKLTQEQTFALRNVLDKIEKKVYRTFLLHGITASGKTEVYLQAIDRVLEKGSSSIVLVPEISLTPQTVARFVQRFGEEVAVVHSRLVGSMRYKEWKKIKDGAARIVVGARSAIFSPVKNLGLIIVDEEHETSYKQEDVPRYNARDVAIQRAKLSNCPVIFGSATPSLESYYQAKKGTYELVRLTKRIDDRSLPKVKIVDMRMELATRKKIVMFSRMLINALQNTIKKHQQAMVFLNRRGFSTYINCKKCGFVLKCKRCDAILVYHFDKKSLICHYCNSKLSPPNICPKCKGSYIRYFGIGTEKVESELSRLIPQARISRMDTDATVKRGSHHRILEDFKRHNIDILVGTQMIAKGLDFPKVTLVGVVNADVTLNLPDFRASERTFNLITQVAGRAGRGEEGGEVIVQTYAPHHYALLNASKHDYEKFYELEIKSRKDLKFPPFYYLIRITLRSRNESKTQKAALNLASALKKNLKDIEVTGPAPAPIARVREYYRWNILLKGKNRSIMSFSLKKALGRIRKPSGVLMAVDVDPISV
ncbi:MAG: primosomal protein N', partial [Candidatus Omnitrophica bacterium]|nr:primosomal protein N' [Candidatus Omnitrophota bacterium]